MKVINLKNRIIFAASAFFAAAFCAGCHIGLGEEVDLVAPSVKISSPDYMEQVTPVFVVEGSCSDDQNVKSLVVSCEDTSWKYEGGVWLKKEDGQSSWSKLGTTEASVVSTGKASFNFSINVSLPDTSYSREITVKATVTDEMGNSSKDSVASRTVVYDVTGPVITITNPVKMYGKRSQIEAALDVYADYKNFTVLSQFNNGTLELSGYQEEDYSLGGLEIIICDATGREYFNSSDDVNEDLRVQIDSNLRNWSISIPQDRIKNPDTGRKIEEKTYMQVLLHSFDTAGNDNGYKDTMDPSDPVADKYDHEAESVGFLSYGWFCWWPQADYPWIEFSNAGSQDFPVSYYPGNAFQGQCFDDDGLDAITVNVTKRGELEPYSTLRLTDLSASDNQTFYNWSVEIPSEVGIYEVSAKTRDVNSNITEWYRGYISVIDVTAPTIDSINSPSADAPLFGDENGDVEFDITVSDDSGIASASVVWIKNETDLINYLNADYELWNEEGLDSNGNLRYQLGLSDPSAEKNSSGRVEYTASCTLNLFEDLKIGNGTQLTAQRFILRVEDANGKTAAREFTSAGDISNPEISFDKIILVASGKSYNASAISGKLLSELHGDDAVEITGKWSDDSTDIWADKTKKGSFVLTWNNAVIPVVTKGDGTWTTGTISAVTGTTASLVASLTDYAANKGVAKLSFQMETESPVLSAITSTTPDGSYTTGKKIYISMKFNKAVTIDGLNVTEGKTPYLVLNNGQNAEYSTGNGTNTHLYVVTLDSDSAHEINDLNVTAVYQTGFSWLSSGVKLDIPATTAGLNNIGNGNLADNKDINIIITKPVVRAVELSQDGQTLTVTFVHDVEKGSGSIVIEQQNLDRAPAVLLESEYEDLAAINPEFENYYELGTNGCSSDGTADLTKKYILRYKYDSTDITLVQMYKATDSHIISVDSVSSAVTVQGSVATIKLTGSYELPVKGASYKVTVPEGFVCDVVNNENTLWNSTVTLSGVEAPVIRVNKSTAGFDTEALTATQPLTSAVKIDCETPLSTIYYSTAVKTFSVKDDNAALNLGSSENTNYPEAGAFPETAAPSTRYSAEINVGTNTVTGLKNWQWGAKYAISALAKTTSGQSNTSYEAAYKSVFVFSDSSVVNSTLVEGGTRVWLRGGDNETGSNLTAGFPLSWDPQDTDGMALLTQDADEGQWYYISWSLNTKAYLTLLAGTVTNDNGKALAQDYYWSVNAWVPFRQFYPLYPGESRIVSSADYSTVWGQTRGGFSFTGLSGQGSGGGAAEDEGTAGFTEEPPVANDNPGTEILTYTCDLAKWFQDITFKGELLKSITAGSKIYITTAVSSNKAASGGVLLMNDWWQTLSGGELEGAVAAQEADKLYYNTTPGTTIVYTLTQEDVDKLVSWGNIIGLRIAGNGLLVTSVKIDIQ